MTKKNKDKANNLSYIKYYTCKQKGHYANNCLEKPKNYEIVSATPILITKKKIEKKLEWIPCIWYLVIFKDQIETLLDLGSKVNVINKGFTS